jgi:hypothetical protein
MQNLIENYINGNLSDAKRMAKRYNEHRLFHGLRDYGYGIEAAMAVAAFLKGYGSFQAACDATHAERKQP